jgi:hypothetical protein
MGRRLRVKTASTRRALDKWKEKGASETSRFYASLAALGAFVLTAPRRGRFFLTVPVLFATSLSFVALGFTILFIVGWLAATLRCYLLVNSFLRLISPIS